MDYEFRIKLLEAETAHLKEMQKLGRERQDADQRQTSLEVLVRQTTEAVGQLAQTVELLARKIDGLIEAMTAEQRNGK